MIVSAEEWQDRHRQITIFYTPQNGQRLAGNGSQPTTTCEYDTGIYLDFPRRVPVRPYCIYLLCFALVFVGEVRK